MQFTFGIITSVENKANKIPEMISNISELMIPCNTDYEIIIVGGDLNRRVFYPNVRHIPFDENIKPHWITCKKNVITTNAQFENIVFLHDYIALCEGWYEGFLKFDRMNPQWQIVMNKIINFDGTRYRDWCVWDDPDYGQSWVCTESWCPDGRVFRGQPRMVPYKYNKTKHMFISGAYWVAKKEVMREQPLNENVMWCQGEDVEWSLRVRNKYKYCMNQYSTVQLLKEKQETFQIVDEIIYG